LIGKQDLKLSFAVFSKKAVVVCPLIKKNSCLERQRGEDATGLRLKEKPAEA